MYAQTPLVPAFNLNGLLVSNGIVFSRSVKIGVLSMTALPSLVDKMLKGMFLRLQTLMNHFE